MFRKRRTATPSSLPSQEEVLVDYAKRLRLHRKGRRAALVHLSRLSRASQHPQDLRLAAEAFLPLARRYEGEIFRLSNHDIVFIAKDVTVAAMDEVVLRLRYMFSDDPYFRQVENASDSDRFCTYFDMERDYDAFLAWTGALLRPTAPDEENPSIVAFTELTRAHTEAEPKPARAPLLDDLQTSAVFAIDRDGRLSPILSEIRFHLSLMRARRGLSTTSGMTDRWLLDVLSDEMTPDFMAACFDNSRSPPRTLVLPLDPMTVLLPEFDRFHETYKRLSRTPALIELNWLEAMREPETFIAARDRLARSGHKLCLADWDIYAFAMSDPRRLSAHFYKISWKPALFENFREDWRLSVAETVRAAGAAKVILTDCSAAASLSFGQRTGIVLYTGAHPDRETKTK